MERDDSLSPFEIWSWYLKMEQQFIEYCEYVPLREEHYKVWSSKLASIIIEICSVLDSFFKAGSPWLFRHLCSDSNGFQKEKREIEENRANIKTWKQIFDSCYNFSEKKVFVIPLKDSICPFKDWKDGNTLKWWETYNNVKHDRFRGLESADFESTLLALSGLFLAIILHVPDKKYLYDLGSIKHVGPLDVARYLCADMLLRKEPIHVYRGDKVIAETSLFSYDYGRKELTRTLSRASCEGGLPGWPSDRLWPECKEECSYTICYRDQISVNNS